MQIKALSLLLLKQEQVTMNPIESILSRYPLMVLDCALGTEIAKRGFDRSEEHTSELQSP